MHAEASTSRNRLKCHHVKPTLLPPAPTATTHPFSRHPTVFVLSRAGGHPSLCFCPTYRWGSPKRTQLTAVLGLLNSLLLSDSLCLHCSGYTIETLARRTFSTHFSTSMAGVSDTEGSEYPKMVAQARGTGEEGHGEGRA